jgi:hypothetical protein
MPHGDDQESNHGAEIGDIPLYRPSFSTPRKASLSKSFIDIPRTPPQTRELETLVTDAMAVAMHVPPRTR